MRAKEPRRKISHRFLACLQSAGDVVYLPNTEIGMFANDKRVSIREFGRGVGVSDTIIRRLIESGVIEKSSLDVNHNNGRPEVIIGPALKNWIDYGKEIKGHYAKDVKTENPKTAKAKKTDPPVKSTPAIKKPVKTPNVDPPENNIGAGRGNNNTNFTPPPKSSEDEYPSKAESDRVKAFWEAEKARIDVERKMDVLVLREDVEHKLFSIAKDLRMELQGIPRKVSAFMTGDKKKDEARLEREIEKILTRFADGLDEKFNAKPDESESE